MRALLLGGTGQLGRALLRAAPAGWETVAPPRSTLDLRDAGAIASAVAAARPDAVINAAAYTDVDLAESERDVAFAVNAEAVGAIARACAARGARLIHVSTDQVFDGERGRPYAPGDPTAPVNAYGESKLLGERHALEVLGERAVVVRTSWLHGAGGKNFVGAILSRLLERGRVEVVADQIGVPTAAATLAGALWRIALRPGIAGLRHWTDAGVASRYDQAVAVAEEAERLGLLQGPWSVAPLRTRDWPAPARRPACVVLDAAATREEIGSLPPHWRDGVRRTLQEARDGA